MRAVACVCVVTVASCDVPTASGLCDEPKVACSNACIRARSG